MTDGPIFEEPGDTNAGHSAMALQKLGGLASFLLAVTFIAAPLIYLTGDLRDPLGQSAYHLADILYGPVWGASLVTAVFALRERIGKPGSRRTALALLAAALAAGLIVTAALLRSTNRQYHLQHPELGLENSPTVLVVWTTLLAGVTASGLHFLGWSLVLLAWAGWTTRRLPRALCALYLAGGVAALFEYVQPELEGLVVILGVFWGVWQGILLWIGGSGERQPPDLT